jgi:peptidoglycan L-alanyl-D-glutamate endopeptidase CwlK
MDCDIDLARFTDAPYVIERPAGSEVLADRVTSMLVAAGLRLEFSDRAAVAVESADLLVATLPEGMGVIDRSNGKVRWANGADTPAVLVCGAGRPGPYMKADRPAVSMAAGGWEMAGHALVGTDRAQARAFAAAMALLEGGTRNDAAAAVSIGSGSTASPAWNVSARVHAYMETCRGRLSPSHAGTTPDGSEALREALRVSEMAVVREATRSSSPEDQALAGMHSRIRLNLAAVNPAEPSPFVRLASLGARVGNHRAQLGESFGLPLARPDTAAEPVADAPFGAIPFGSAADGPSYLPFAKFNAESLRVVQGLHPDLLKVVARASEISSTAFQVVPGNGGMRSERMQRKLKAKGASRAVLGRHTIGHAIDLVPVDAQGRVDFSDLDGFDRIMTAMKQAAEELSIPIEWGGNWKSLVDKPHFELNRRVYPGPSEKARPDEALVAFR